MAKLEDLAERVDRLVLRHQELKRTTALIAQQLQTVSGERDSLRSRLAAARARVDALLERLPSDDGRDTAAASAASNVATVSTAAQKPVSAP